MSENRNTVIGGALIKYYNMHLLRVFLIVVLELFVRREPGSSLEYDYAFV